MKKAALLLCTLLLAALAGCQLGGKAIILPKAGNITAIQVETLEGESLSLTQEEDIARLLEVLNTGWSIGRESVQDQPLVEPYGTIRLETGAAPRCCTTTRRGTPPWWSSPTPAFSAWRAAWKAPCPRKTKHGQSEKSATVKLLPCVPRTRLPYKPPSGVEKEPADRGQRPRLRVRLPPAKAHRGLRRALCISAFSRGTLKPSRPRPGERMEPMEYLNAFWVGGLICVIGQLLIDLTKLTPARIMVLFVTVGVVLGALGLYGPLAEFAGCGATVPLTGFGWALSEGVRKAVAEEGFFGVFTGGLSAGAAGTAAAIFFGTLAALVAKPRDKA